MSAMFNRNRKGQQLGEGHDGPNWVLIAGGAAVTVISFVIGRRESISRGGGLEKRKDNYRLPKPDSKKGIAYIATVGDKRIQTKYNGHQSDSYADGESTPLTSHFQIQRTKSCKRDMHSTSLPSSPKPCKEILMSPPCTDEDLLRSSASPVSLQRVVSEKCDVVHRLQQQLKRCDETISDLQAQIIDQGHTVASHQSHIANLEAQLEEKSNILFDSTQEVQCLKRALADQSVKFDGCSRDCNGFDDTEVVKLFNREGETLSGEVKLLEIEKRELGEEVARLECEKRERELVAQAISQEHESLVQRVVKLEIELEEVRKSAVEKDYQSEMNEQDQMEKTNTCCDQKQKQETQEKKLEEELQSQERKVVDADNTTFGGQLSGNNKLHSSRKSHAKALTVRTGMVNSPSCHTGCGAHTYSTALKRSDGSNHTVSKFKTGSKGRQQLKTRGLSSGWLETVTNITALDPVVNEITFKPPEQDVQQLRTPLAIQPNMVSEPKQEMTRLIDDFQTSDNMEDDAKEHMDTTPMRLSSDKTNWAELSQHFSFSTGVTLPTQVKELTHKLEQVAKQQQIDEEMAELKSQQAKIAELKSRVSKFSTTCQLWYTCTNGDKVRDWHTLQAAGLVLEFADRLAAQEQQERQASIHKRSNSAVMTPDANGDTKQSLSRYIAQDKRPRENFPTSFDHPISFTFTEEVARPAIDDGELHPMPSRLAEEPHNFPLATLGHPASKIQTLFSNGVKKSTSRKNQVGRAIGNEYLMPNWSSDSKKNSSPIKHVESNGFHTDTKSSDSGATSVPMRTYLMPERKPSLGGKSHNTESDQKLGGHQTGSMEDNSSLLSLEIEQVMAETSSLPLLSHLHQDPRFSAIMKFLTVPVESPMVAIDSRSSRSSWFKQGNYINDGEVLVDPPQSQGKPFTEDKEEGATEEDEISSRNYNHYPGQRIQMCPDPATLSPISKMLASLDLKKPSSTPSPQTSETFWEDIPIFPGDITGEFLGSHITSKISMPPKTADEEEAGSPGSSASSIDSAFNEILEDTLEDLVKVCSVGTSLAGTPSSAFSQGSVSKHVQLLY